MRKRKCVVGLLPGHQKQKRKGEEHSFSIVGSVEVRAGEDMMSLSDKESELEKKNNTILGKDLGANVVLKVESEEQIRSFGRTPSIGDILSESLEDLERLDVASVPCSLLRKGDDVSIMAAVEHEKRSGFFPKEGISSLRLDESCSDDDSSAISNVVNADSVMKTDSSTSTDNNLSPLTGKKDDSLMEGAMVDSKRTGMLSAMDSKARDVKYTYTKRNKSIILEGKHISLGNSESAQENVSSQLSPVAENCTLAVISSSQEISDISTVCKNNSEASISDKTENDTLSKCADSNIMKTSDRVPKNNSQFCEAKDRKRGKKKFFGMDSPNCTSVLVVQGGDSVNSSSLSAVDDMGPVTKVRGETSLSDNTTSSIEKEASDLTERFSDTNKSEMFPEVNSVSEIAKDNNSVETSKQKHEVMKKVAEFSKDGSAKSDDGASLIESYISAEVASNSYLVEDPSSIQSEKGESNQRESLYHSGFDTRQVFEIVAYTLLKGVVCGGADDSVRASESQDRSGIGELNLKLGTHEAPICNSGTLQENEDLLGGFHKASEDCVVSAEGNVKLLPTDHKERVSLPPSPIRGVIEGISSSVLPMKQNHKLDTFNEEGASFSFQVGGKALMNDLSLNNSYVAHESGSRVGSDKEQLAILKNNQSKFTDNGGETTDSQKKAGVSSSVSFGMEDVISSDVVNLQSQKLEAVRVPPGALIRCTRKKLLVLDLNGLLADINQDYRSPDKAHKRIGGKLVFKRPFCDEFLKFCFERFNIGVWSSRRKYNVDAVVDFLMGDLKHNLLFCWDQSKCTVTGYRTIENVHKPLVLKELKKLWNKEESDLQWEKGDYSPSNTLLVDDSPYKALRNPPHTAIFPHPYHFSDENDKSLGQGGDLRIYVEGLAMADDVQHYVQEHPFGQPAITDSNPSWEFYLRIIDKFEKSSST